MKTIKTLLLIAFFGLSLAGSALAQQTATYEVQAINEFSSTGSPSLVVNSATAGSAPDAATDATSTYSITTNETNRKITAALGTAFTSGVTLSLNMAAPTGATSAGTKVLGTTAIDMVTGITEVNESGLTMTYTLDADVTDGVVASATKEVTFTIIAGGSTM